MNFIKLNKEEYEINYTNFKDQYVVIDNSLIYNGEIVGKVDIKIRRHAPMPYNFSILPIVDTTNSIVNILKEQIPEESQMDLEGTILFEEVEE